MGSERDSLPAVPVVAVCVPVRGRSDELRRLLAALREQDWPADSIRVVVAIDGPDESLRESVVGAGFEAVVLERAAGSYAARNAGLEQIGAEADIVLFTDSDCIPVKGWIRAHVEALRTADLSGGAVDVTVRQPASAVEIVDRARHLRQKEYVLQNGYAATANLGVRRRVADLRFDADRRTGGDSEFCRRAVKAGFSLVYAAEARVEHPARRTLPELSEKVLRLCKGIIRRRADYAGRWIPRPSIRMQLVREARTQGLSRGLLWEGSVVLLDLAASSLVSLAVAAARLTAGWGRRTPSSS